MGPLISGKSRLVKYYNLARSIPSLKLTFSQKMGWLEDVCLSFWDTAHSSGAFAVSFREGINLQVLREVVPPRNLQTC